MRDMLNRNRYHQRHAAIVTPDDFPWPIHVVGLGAVGSYATLFLAKLGVADLHVYDYDRIAHENVGNQLYGPSDVGRLKALAVADRVAAATGIRPEPYIERIQRREFQGLVILAVDSMQERRSIFEGSIRGHAAVRWLLDVRIGFLPGPVPTEAGLLFTVQPLIPATRADYERSLYDDARALPTPCGASGIVYASTLLAGKLVRRVVQIARGETVPPIERILP